MQVIRHHLSGAVGDLIYGVCGATGATTTKIHAPFLWQPDDYYNENYYEVYIYAGVNIGLTRRVTDWVLSTNLLTVHTAYAAACNATSYAELHRIFTSTDYLNAINLSIASLADKYVLPLTDETTIKLTSTTDNLSNIVPTYEYDLPATMTHLYQVTTEHGVSGVKLTGTVSGAFTAGETVTGDSSGATGELSYGPAGGTYIRVRKVDGTFILTEAADGASEGCSSITAVDYETAGLGKWYPSGIIDYRDWEIVKVYPTGTSQLRLDKAHYSVDEDLYLRLDGHMRQPVLAGDTEVCYLPLDWIVQKAITYLPHNKIESNKLDKIYDKAVLISSREPKNYPHPNSHSVME